MQTSTTSAKTLPRDARLISLIMASMGIDDAEPGTVAMLLEFTHRWTADILNDSLVYHDHAGRGSQNVGAQPRVEDLRIAVQAKIDLTCTNAWPKEYLSGLAQGLNKLPLPEIKDSYGVSLPPEAERLTGVNYDLRPRRAPPVAAPKDEDESMYGEDESMADADASATGDGDMSMEPEGMQGVNGTNGKRSRSESDEEREDDEEFEQV